MSDTPPHQPHAPRLLIASHHAEAGLALKELGEKNGYTVLRCFTATQALERARADRPDVIVLDESLLDVDTLDTSRALRDDPLIGASTPILLVTASRPTTAQHRAALRGGVWEFLAYPFNEEEVAARLARRVGGPSGRCSRRAAAAPRRSGGSVPGSSRSWRRAPTALAPCCWHSGSRAPCAPPGRRRPPSPPMARRRCGLGMTPSATPATRRSSPRTCCRAPPARCASRKPRQPRTGSADTSKPRGWIARRLQVTSLLRRLCITPLAFSHDFPPPLSPGIRRCRVRRRAGRCVPGGAYRDRRHPPRPAGAGAAPRACRAPHRLRYGRTPLRRRLTRCAGTGRATRRRAAGHRAA